MRAFNYLKSRYVTVNRQEFEQAMEKRVGTINAVIEHTSYVHGEKTYGRGVIAIDIVGSDSVVLNISEFFKPINHKPQK